MSTVRNALADVVSAGILLVLASTSASSSTAGDPAAVIDVDRVRVELDDRGESYRVVRNRSYRIHDPDRVGALAEPGAYTSQLIDLETFDVEVRNDGVERLDRSKSDAERLPLHADYALYSDAVYVWHRLSPRAGDEVSVVVEETHEPVLGLPGHAFAREWPVTVAEFELVVPPGYPFRWLTTGDVPAPDVSPDSTTWTWTYHDPPTCSPDADDIGRLWLSAGRVMGRPILDWCDVAGVFAPDYADARRAESVSALAHDIAARVASERAAAIQVIDALDDRLHYVAVWVGLGGWFPPAADETLDRGYGDCKAMANLLTGALEAVGLRASPALIATRSSDFVPRPELPVALGFDHVITMVEVDGDTLWVDLTSDRSTPAELPWWDQGRLVLPLSPECRGLVRTPIDPPDRNTRVVTLEGHVDEEGSLTAELRVRLTGQEALAYRGQRVRDRSRWSETTRSILGGRATGSIRVVELLEEAGDIVGAFEVSAPRVLRRIGSRAGLDLSFLNDLIPRGLPDSTGAWAEEATFCRLYDERVRLAMPATLRPAGRDSVATDVSGGIVTGRMTGRFAGGSLDLSRELRVEALEVVPGDFSASHRAATRVRQRRGGIPPLESLR